MCGDEICARQAIAVEEYANFAGAGANAAIADFAAAETTMLVVNLLERHQQPRSPALNDARSVRPRAVVGDDDLEIFICLMRQRAQGGIERILAVIGGDDDGNECRAGHGLAPEASGSAPAPR